MTSLREQDEAAQRASAIAEAKKIIAGHQLTRAQDRLADLERDDFERRVASKPLKELTVSERSEIVRRLGYRRFEELLFAEHAR
jgi:hypothetical protein